MHHWSIIKKSSKNNKVDLPEIILIQTFVIAFRTNSRLSLCANTISAVMPYFFSVCLYTSKYFEQPYTTHLSLLGIIINIILNFRSSVFPNWAKHYKKKFIVKSLPFECFLIVHTPLYFLIVNLLKKKSSIS